MLKVVLIHEFWIDRMVNNFATTDKLINRNNMTCTIFDVEMNCRKYKTTFEHCTIDITKIFPNIVYFDKWFVYF